MKQGVYQIEHSKYHSDPCIEPSLSSTLARLIINRSPLHAWTASPRLNHNYEEKESRIFDIGRAAHRAVLGKGDDYVKYPEDFLSSDGAARTAAAKKFSENMRGEGRTALKSDDYDCVFDMASAVSHRLDLMGVKSFDPAHSEITAIAEIDGVWCRAMIDHSPADFSQPLWDLKTTTDASPDSIQRAVMNYGYDIQAAHYCDVWKAATGEERKFRFLFVEKDAPHECAVVELGWDSMEMGRRRMKHARNVWAECLKSGVWNGYPVGILQIDLPDWYQQRYLEREEQFAQRKNNPTSEMLACAHEMQKPIF